MIYNKWRHCSLLYCIKQIDLFHVAVRLFSNRDLEQPRWRRKQERHKYATKNSSFAHFARRAFFSIWHFKAVLFLSTSWNDLFCSCVDDVSMLWHIFSFVFLLLKHWFQYNFRIVRAHFASVTTWITEKRLQKREIMFSDNVFAVVGVAFA